MKSSQTSIPVEKEFLEGLLQRVLGCRSVKVGEWEGQGLSGGLEYDTAIHRLCGVAACDGKPQTWSLIVKVIRSGARSVYPQGITTGNAKRWLTNPVF